MTWPPGVSGNPGGRAKAGTSYAELIRKALARPYVVRPPKRPTNVSDEDRLTFKQFIVEAMVYKATLGDLPALTWLADRDEGKVKEHLAVEGGLSVVPWAEKPAGPEAGEDATDASDLA